MSEAPEAPIAADAELVELGSRRIFLVGTAHISRESVERARRVIERERPDRVCIELDARRFEALSDETHWERLDLRELIRRKQLATLLVNLLLTSIQRQLSKQLGTDGVTPGSELLEAARAAEAMGIPVELSDRDVRVTLRRAWHALSLWQRLKLLSGLLAASIESPEVTPEELERLRQQDVLTQLMSELGEAMPPLKRVLIDERDAYLAQRIREAPGECLVAVVGAGHVAGMRSALLSDAAVDMDQLGTVPPVSPAWKFVGWAIPATIVGAILYIGISKGPQAAGANALYWFLVHAVPAALGCAVALGHPLTIAAGFLAAPFTSLSPVIGAGHVAAFVQTWLRPPRVAEFRSAGDDASTLRGWWRSRLLRVFLVFILSTIGSLLGTWLGGVQILRNLF